MAKKKESNKSKGRVRVFFAEIEGDDETIQDGLKAMATAVGKTFQPTTIIQRMPAPPLLPESSQSDAEFEDVLDAEYEESVDWEEESPKPKSSKRKIPKMQLIKDLDLRPDGKKSLGEFYGEKAPKTQADQIAVHVYYLRKILELEEVTSHHVYTCFKEVSVKVPNDLPQIIRNTANKKGTVDTSDANCIRITTIGENLVEHDLPKKTSSKE